MANRLIAAMSLTLGLACTAPLAFSQEKKAEKPKAGASKDAPSKDSAASKDPKDSKDKKAGTPAKDTPAEPETAAVRGVRQAHASLLRFLGSGENSKIWQKYLMSDDLSDQLQRSRKADRQVVKAIVAKYSGSAQGLSMPQFRAVRSALQAWQVELATPTEEELPQAARDATGDFRPATEQEVAQAKSAVQRALATLESFVGAGSGWRTVLKLDDLQAQLKKPQPEPDVLAQVLQRFSRDYRGLEMRQFTSVRNALADYLSKVRVAQDSQAEANCQKQLAALADALTAYRSGQKASDLEKVAQALRWLEERDQAREIVKVARQAYWKPNLFLDISPEVATYGFRDSVDETEGINESRSNAQVVGRLRTIGSMNAKLKPFGHVAVIHNEFQGNAYSRTTAYASQATVYSRATTTIHAIKQVSLDRHGFHDYPTTAYASTQSYTERIDSAYQSQASQRVEQSRPENNDRASRRAEDRIRSRMDRETRKQLAEANDDFYRQFVNPLTKYDAFPAELYFSSTPDALRVRGLQAMEARLAATEEPPQAPENKDLTWRVHESWLNNTAWAMYRDRTVAEEEFRQEMTDILGREPKRFKRTDDSPPWTIGFAGDSPISVRVGTSPAGPGQLIVSMHGTSFKSGKSAAQEIPMKVTAAYTVAKDDRGPKWVRQGELQVYPPDLVARFDKDGDDWLNRDEYQKLIDSKTQLPAAQTSLRGQLEEDFAKLFEEELRPEPQTLSGRWKSLGELKPDYLAVTEGWLTLGYVVQQPAKKDAKAGTAKAGAAKTETAKTGAGTK